MTTIKASCATCGEVSLVPEQIDLRIDDDGASYAFRCPMCLDVVRKPADARIVDLLVSGGVELRYAAPAVPQPPPFTRDDLLEFHELLERDDWFDLVLADGSVQGMEEPQRG